MRTAQGINRLILIGCALGASFILPAHAGDGRIVITRDVQPRMAIRAPMIPDPNPVTVNANPSALVIRATNELNDGDFAGVRSGAGISGMVLQQTNNLGGNFGNQTQLPNLAGGRGSGSGNGIANMVNSSVQQGMGALNVLKGGQ